MRVRCEDSGPLFGPEQAAICQRTRRGARRKIGRGIQKLSGRTGGSVGEVGRGVERRLRQLDGGIRHEPPRVRSKPGISTKYLAIIISLLGSPDMYTSEVPHREEGRP